MSVFYFIKLTFICFDISFCLLTSNWHLLMIFNYHFTKSCHAVTTFDFEVAANKYVCINVRIIMIISSWFPSLDLTTASLQLCLLTGEFSNLQQSRKTLRLKCQINAVIPRCNLIRSLENVSMYRHMAFQARQILQDLTWYGTNGNT